MDSPPRTLNVVAGLYGNALEWYDFTLYASFATLFQHLYFPTHSSFGSLALTFLVFALGFFIRPLGGIVFGHIGDKLGRRKTLIYSVTLMTLATTLIAFLPTYQSIGIAAPLLFTLLRMFQGFAVGGELPNSATFLIETLFSNRAFGGSLVGSTAFLGILIGMGVATFITHFTSTATQMWSWRIAYLVGGLMGFIGIYLRYHSSESTQFLENTSKQVSVPFKEILINYKLPLLLAVLLTSILAAGNYTLIAYTIVFLTKSGFSLADALKINFSGLLTLTFLIPLMGLLGDKIGIKRVFKIGLFAIMLFIFPAFMLLQQHDFMHALYGEILFSIILAPVNGTIAASITSMFPVSIRASGNSMGYNIGQAIFGGTAPLVSLALVEYTGNIFAPAWYIFALSIVVFLSILRTNRL